MGLLIITIVVRGKRWFPAEGLVATMQRGKLQVGGSPLQQPYRRWDEESFRVGGSNGNDSHVRDVMNGKAICSKLVCPRLFR